MIETESITSTVFISSTVEEFRDLRSALAYTLRAQGYNVCQSEAADFDVQGDRSAFDECFENIRNSDYYILLIGSRRGSLFEDDISITRKEYRVAGEAFLTNGKPRMFLYLRESSELALGGSRQDWIDAGIDDPNHLASFICEVQSPEIESTPNYLTRFRSFEDIMSSLSIRMNLGRNLLEKLVRHSLLSELLSNLALMVERGRNTVSPRHRYMAKVRENIVLTAKDIYRSIDIKDEYAIALGISLIGRVKGDDLQTRCIESALDRGVFLTFDPQTSTLQESRLHQALQQTLEDIRLLRQIDGAHGVQDWDTKMVNEIGSYRHGQVPILEIPGIELACAFAHYDRTENVFGGHLALCQVLLGLFGEIPLYQRQPITPFGEEEELKMRSSHVSRPEIAKLIQNDIWPLGKRVPREIYGKTRQEQVEALTESAYKSLEDLDVDDQLLKGMKEVLKEVMGDYLDKELASYDEGIESRDTHREMRNTDA